MPLADNHEALNMSGKIIALSVNQRRAPPVDGKTFKVIYTVTVGLDTEDAAAVNHLLLVRGRSTLVHLNETISADLIVWPKA
jgi:hypothetical protein